jgi:hypothetical protein
MHDFLFILGPIIVWMLLCALVGRFAASFQRPPATWFLLAALLSPAVAAVILLCLGNPEQAIAMREKEERIRQRHPERTDLREAALSEMECPHCGAAVNPITEDGLHSLEAEPWLLLCNKCEGTIEPDV